MKQQVKELTNKLDFVIVFVKKYLALAFFVGIFGAFGFLVFRINQFSNVSPSDDAVTEKLQSTPRPKIDEAAVDKINQLQSQNIEVQTLFDEARKNPFSE